MIITDDRTRLDSALVDPDTTVLLLSGDEDSKAREIHDFIHGAELEAWRKCFLISDLKILKASERKAWFDGENSERYAALGGTTKKLAVRGPIDDLLTASDEPSILEIRQAFARGDKVK